MNDYNSIVKTLKIIRVFSCNIDMKSCFEAFNDESKENQNKEASSQKAA
jgi:hypothetical protein